MLAFAPTYGTDVFTQTEQLFGTDGQPTLCSGGCAKTVIAYDGGQVTETRYDLNGDVVKGGQLTEC